MHPADNFPLFKNTRCSRTTKKTTEFLFNTIYKPRCNNSYQSTSYAWYCIGMYRLLWLFPPLIVSSFTLSYFILHASYMFNLIHWIIPKKFLIQLFRITVITALK